MSNHQDYLFLENLIINDDERLAINLLKSLQQEFALNLANVATKLDCDLSFKSIPWLRNSGRWGGGQRLQSTSGNLFDRASINFSHVNYSTEASRPLNSATALSTIIHPLHPCAPSIHIHLSYAAMKHGKSYWRIMADLNPSIQHQKSTNLFHDAIKSTTGAFFTTGIEQGDKYFVIPALGRSRGICHFYLEDFSLGNFKQDHQFAQQFANQVLSIYPRIIEDTLNEVRPTITPQQRLLQLEYHTLYFFQVMTLDRGTTAGLLVHDENDLGILASLPSRIDIDLLNIWQQQMNGSHQILTQEIIRSLGGNGEIEINDLQKKNLALTLRMFYQKFPAAQELQAKGDVIPQTLKNHNS
jgi:coproporphyrinogen III oxidase